MKQKKKLIPVTDIVLPEKHTKTSEEMHTQTANDAEVFDLKFEAVHDFGSSKGTKRESIFDTTKKESSTTLGTQRPYNAYTSTRPRVSSHIRRWWIWGVIGICCVVLGYLVLYVFPRVTIVIATKKIPFDITKTITVTASSTIAQEGVVNGEIIAERKTNIFKFPATGTQTSTTKAKGTVVIFNTYGTSPQTLVAGTRLQAPDGKIFRLDTRVVVPGGKKTGQVLDPGMVEATVTADQAGDAYNIDPVEHFTIPGFSGTDNYTKFYASSAQPMSGGSNGETTIASKEDIEKAQKDVEIKMKESASTTLALKIPKGFIAMPGSEQFKVLTKKVDARVDADKNFSIALEAEFSVIIFKEIDVRGIMQASARMETGVPERYVEREATITYQDTQINQKTGVGQMKALYKGDFWNIVDATQVQQAIRGKKETELKSYILNMQGIDRLTVSFWPFWVAHVPQNTSHIRITVE